MKHIVKKIISTTNENFVKHVNCLGFAKTAQNNHFEEYDKKVLPFFAFLWFIQRFAQFAIKTIQANNITKTLQNKNLTVCVKSFATLSPNNQLLKTSIKTLKNKRQIYSYF